MVRSARALVALALLLPAPPARGAGEDWYLVRIVAGPEGASGVRLRVDETLFGDGEAPMATGTGIARGDDGGTIDVELLHGGPGRVTTTADAGGVDVVISEGADPHETNATSRWRWDGALAPGESVVALRFVTGMEFVDVDVFSPSASSGSVTATVRRGSGSVALAVSPTDRGAGAAAGPAAAGSVVRRVRAARSIAGALALDFCIGCGVVWSSPQRTGGSVAARALPPVTDEPIEAGDPTFAGPSGDWQWIFTGAGVVDASKGAPIYGAYAPVGADWEYFSTEG